jgi:iron complex transport system substrate-binding protein
MRIVSLVPSATEIVFALGLGDELVGRTNECDFPAEAADVPVVTRARVAPSAAGSRQVDALVTAALSGGESIYELDLDALARADPDLVLTQRLCSVCAVSRDEVVEGLQRAGSQATVASLDPESIEGILNAISTVGAMAVAEDEALGLVELLRERLAKIENRVLERRLEAVPARRVVCLEWLDPLFSAGHWVPEQVRRAGGWELLGTAAEPSRRTTWQHVREVDPEQLMLMPCGYDAWQTAAEWTRVELPSWLAELRAVEQGEVYALDGSAYFSRPGPRVIDGIALLAELFDPGTFLDLAPAGAWLPLGGVHEHAR